VMEFFQSNVSKGETHEKYEYEKDRLGFVDDCSHDCM
jgi:hypothetical protein